MQVIKTIREMQKWSMDRKKAGKTVAVVPTMGFLHEGHLSLIDAARANGADAVVVTIFVNLFSSRRTRISTVIRAISSTMPRSSAKKTSMRCLRRQSVRCIPLP